MAPNRAQKCYLKRKQDEEKYKLYLEKKRELNNKYRARKAEKLANNSELLTLNKVNERDRKRRYRKNVLKRKQNVADFVEMDYQCPQTLGKALAKVKKALPAKETHRKTVISKIALEIFPNGIPVQNIPSKCSRGLSTVIEEAVINFYNRDDISRVSPSKNDLKSVKDIEGKRSLKPIRHMMFSIKESFELFKEDNPNLKIKISKFYDLRPTEVFVVSKMPHNVCVCSNHANAEFILTTLRKTFKDFPKTLQNLVTELCCNKLNEKCILGDCDKCFEVGDLIPIKYKVVNDTWKQWKLVEKKNEIGDALWIY